MECMRGPVDDMMSPSYQRLRQLIEAHVRAPHLETHRLAGCKQP